MPIYIALLRAVNVGGTGKLPMTELVAMCQKAGFKGVRTYIASGNAVFSCEKSEGEVQPLPGGRYNLQHSLEMRTHLRD